MEKAVDMAFYWYGKAAELNNPQAAYNLSIMYEKGWGCQADAEKARQWLELAAELGEPKAKERLVGLQQ